MWAEQNCQQMQQYALQRFNHIPNRLTSPFQDAITNSVELATCYEEGKRSKAQSQKKNSKLRTEWPVQQSCRVIYVIECEKCNLQYVGQTNKSLRQWMAKHREGLRAGKPRRIYYRFNRADHTETDMKVTPIEMVPTEVDILAWEQEWINRLRTRNPDGLNFYWPPDTRTYIMHVYNQQQRIHHDADYETRRQGTSQQDRQQDEQCCRPHHKFCI